MSIFEVIILISVVVFGLWSLLYSGREVRKTILLKHIQICIAITLSIGTEQVCSPNFWIFHFSYVIVLQIHEIN